ncbi:MAG: hypothetical protein ABI925_11750, partial [Verrucomicrobiota bacterium]
MKKPSSLLKKATTSGGLIGAMAIAGGTSAYADISAISRISPGNSVRGANPPIATGVPPDLTNTAGAA